MHQLALFFDTETTGLIENMTTPEKKQPEIIEFYGALIDMDTGEMIDEIDELIKPTRPASEEITKITGITNEMLEGRPSFRALSGRIKSLIEKAPAVVAHNLSFDMEMVDVEMNRLGDRIAWPRLRICTVEQTIHLKGFRLNLTALHEHLFGERFPEAHRAKNDVLALIRCALELRKRDEI